VEKRIRTERGRFAELLGGRARARILMLRQPQTLHLRTWAERIASRRGKKTAVVALAPQLAGILFAMRREGKAYTPPQLAHTPTMLGAGGGRRMKAAFEGTH
jgi:hypothetical protein